MNTTANQTGHVLIDRAALSLSRFASKEPSRYELAGVHVLPDGTAAATNGHVLLTVPPCQILPAEFPEVPGLSNGAIPKDGVLIGSEVAERVQKAIPRKTDIPVLGCAIVTGSAVACTDLEQVTQGKLTTDAKFPDYSQVIPEPDKIRQVSVDAHYLKMIAEFAIANGDRKAIVTLQPGKTPAEDCIRIEVDLADCRVAVGALMPLRRK